MTLYSVTVTDTGFDPVVIPVKSFALRIRQSPKKIYLSVTVPAGLTYIDDCIDRADGIITLDCLSPAVEIVAANIDTIRLIESAATRTINIVAYKQTTFPGGTEHTISNSVELIDDAVIALPDPTIKPADTVILSDGERFTVTDVNWNSSGYMELLGREPRGAQLRLSANSQMQFSGSQSLYAPIVFRGDLSIQPVAEGSLPVFPRYLAASLGAVASMQSGLTAVYRLSSALSMSSDLFGDLSKGADDFVSLVIDSDPIGYWKLGGAGSSEPNFGTGGSAYDATLSGSYYRGYSSIVPGDTGDCTLFRDVTPDGVMTIPAAFPQMSTFTIMMWVDPWAPWSSSYEVVFYRGSSTNTMFIRIKPSTNVSQFAIGSDGLTASAQTENYSCIFITRQNIGDDAYLYVNDDAGVFDGAFADPGSHSGKPILIGAVSSPPIDAYVQHVAIWDRVLSTAEREAIRDAGLGV